ncbi:MAG: ribosome maturation factor RimM [Syntrophomonadaceae bacterium]|nr:ribosome maturation factor RimM [Syntrophomonadaceae bacterium]
MTEKPRVITIGQVTTTHGNRGEVRVLPLTDFPGRFSRLREIILEHDGRKEKVCLESARPHRQFVILKLQGIDDPEAAQRLRGARLQISEAELMPLPEGHYYIFQLLGLSVYTEEGKYLGIIDDIFRTGSNDVYRVIHEERKELLVPALKQVVTDIDLVNRRMVIRPLPGLLES